MSNPKPKTQSDPTPDKPPKDKKEFRGMKGKDGKRSLVALEQDDATISISYMRYLVDGTTQVITATATKIRKKEA